MEATAFLLHKSGALKNVPFVNFGPRPLSALFCQWSLWSLIISLSAYYVLLADIDSQRSLQTVNGRFPVRRTNTKLKIKAIHMEKAAQLNIFCFFTVKRIFL